MEKVKCARCGAIGYTASPDSVKCYKCGDSRKIIEMGRHDCRIKNEDTYYHIEGLNGGGR